MARFFTRKHFYPQSYVEEPSKRFSIVYVQKNSLTILMEEGKVEMDPTILSSFNGLASILVNVLRCGHLKYPYG
jgi:hypothetical protein